MNRFPSTRFAVAATITLFFTTVVAPQYRAQFAAAGQARPPSSCVPPSSRGGVIGGIVWSHSSPGSSGCGAAAPPRNQTQPIPPYRGAPPLTFHGGPLVGTTTPGELTVTPVYWVPAGGPYSFPVRYETLINTFLADAAKDSGKPSNVFSSMTQYTTTGRAHLSYLLHAGTPMTDTDAFPTSGCSPDTGPIWSDGTPYSECITAAQLTSEARAFTAAHGLPTTDLAHLYMFLMPKGVETCFTNANGAEGGTCSINASSHGICGWHLISEPLIAELNYAVVDSPLLVTCSSDGGSNTGGNQSPNGNIDADTAIWVASHEIIETITDPLASGWYDRRGLGGEISDDCAYIYGDSRSFQGAAGALFNQTINGHHYFIQEEFSNQDFRASKAYSCIQLEDSIAVSPKSGPPGTHVTVTGAGFASQETVDVTYDAGPASPTPVVVCTTKATNIGTFECSGYIPLTATAGAAGAHTITAKGRKSLRRPITRFRLT